MSNVTVVLVPDKRGNLLICDLEQLLMRLGDPDYSDNEAVESATIDSIDDADKSMRERLTKVHALNQTGDATAYWRSQG